MTQAADERRPVRRVGVVAKGGLTAAAALLGDIADWLQARGVEPVFSVETAALAGRPDARSASRDELPHHADLVLVLGGDGTLLAMADRIAQADREIPILGVNFGSLGFLTEVTLPELYPSLASVLEGRAVIDRRLMLQAETTRDRALHARAIVLNDVVITKGALSRIITLSVWVNDELVTRYRADGLIVATATGSTAYNLASGGPIVHPVVDAILLTPIAPHTLTNRPIVIPAASKVLVQPLIDGEKDESFVTFDGQSGFPLRPGDEVRIATAARAMRLVRASTRSYFEVLRQKLKWGER
jgi:NAD+ kinase